MRGATTIGIATCLREAELRSLRKPVELEARHGIPALAERPEPAESSRHVLRLAGLSSLNSRSAGGSVSDRHTARDKAMRDKIPGCELKLEMKMDRAMMKRLLLVVTAALVLSLVSLSCTPSPAPTLIAELEAMISQLETEQTALATAAAKLSQREVRTAELEAMVSQLETTLATAEGKLPQREGRIAELEAMISRLETEQTALVTAEAKLTQREGRIVELEAMISELETEQTAPATAQSEFSQEIVDKARAVGIEARKSVVFLEITKEDGSGHATAYFLEGGLLLTSGHNVQGAVTIKGYTIDGDTFSVEVINWSHIPVDVAVLRTDYTKAPGLPVGSSERLKEGDPLVQVGHPGGIGNWVITLGEFVMMHGSRLIGTVPSAGGMSGSPVLTLDGKVVGILSGRVADPRGEGFFLVPIELGAPPSDSEIYQSLEEEPKLTFSSHDLIERVLEQVAEWTE